MAVRRVSTLVVSALFFEIWKLSNLNVFSVINSTLTCTNIAPSVSYSRAWVLDVFPAITVFKKSVKLQLLGIYKCYVTWSTMALPFATGTFTTELHCKLSVPCASMGFHFLMHVSSILLTMFVSYVIYFEWLVTHVISQTCEFRGRTPRRGQVSSIAAGNSCECWR